MSNTIHTPAPAIIALAEQFIDAIVGTDTRECRAIGNGQYLISDFTSEAVQQVSATHIVAGIFAWAVETLDDTVSKQLEVETASAIVASRCGLAIELMHLSDSQAGLEIWERMGMIALTERAL